MSSPESTSIEVDVETGSSAGERLRQARESLKFSVQDIAEKIRIDVSKVCALENGDVESIGAPVFAAGYIRAYARIVALPADELIAEYEGIGHINAASTHSISENDSTSLGLFSGELPAAFSMGKKSRRWRLLVRWMGMGILIAVIAILALWFFKGGNLLSPVISGGNSESMNFPQDGSLKTEADGRQALVIPGQEDYVPTPESDAAGMVSLAPLSPDVQDDSVSLAESENNQMPMQAAILDELNLQFQDDSWVEVNDARQQRLIHQLARAGQVHTLHGVAPFSLVLGYVPGVTILHNGETVDLSKYQGRRLVRLIVGKETGSEN